jgi:uncharacterized protein (TIGR03084 family)
VVVGVDHTVVMEQICDDLEAEHQALDALVDHIDDVQWDQPTAAPGWSVRDQVSHVWFFDQRALMALTDADAFDTDRERLMASGGTAASVLPGRSMSGPEMLAAWRVDRAELVRVAHTVDPSSRVPWYGPSMAARSFITARLMETWAHGYDVADALGRTPEPTERLRHVAHIGVRARPFSYAVHDMPLPAVDVSVILTTPAGQTVSWGPADVSDRVSGAMLDFCLVVTQRRHLADTGLEVMGDAAREWISIAQAFAGEPGGGRQPGQFPRS